MVVIVLEIFTVLTVTGNHKIGRSPFYSNHPHQKSCVCGKLSWKQKTQLNDSSAVVSFVRVFGVQLGSLEKSVLANGEKGVDLIPRSAGARARAPANTAPGGAWKVSRGEGPAVGGVWKILPGLAPPGGGAWKFQPGRGSRGGVAGAPRPGIEYAEL